MVTCPKCKSSLQARKILVLSNNNTVICQTCSSRLRVENKGVNSKIGGAGGAVGAVSMFLLLRLLFQTGNLLYLALMAAVLTVLLSAVFLLVNKYVKVKVE